MNQRLYSLLTLASQLFRPRYNTPLQPLQAHVRILRARIDASRQSIRRNVPRSGASSVFRDFVRPPEYRVVRLSTPSVFPESGFDPPTSYVADHRISTLNSNFYKKQQEVLRRSDSAIRS